MSANHLAGLALAPTGVPAAAVSEGPGRALARGVYGSGQRGWDGVRRWASSSQPLGPARLNAGPYRVASTNDEPGSVR